MVFGGGWASGGRRFSRRDRAGGGVFGNPYGRQGGGYRRRGGGGGCARDACLLEGGCCLAEGLDGNCLLLTLGLVPQLLATLIRGRSPKSEQLQARTWLSARLVASIEFYQQRISPHLAGSCRFEPSCSHYAVQAVVNYGSWQGSWLTLRRLLRCRPGGRRGLDPVPPVG